MTEPRTKTMPNETSDDYEAFEMSPHVAPQHTELHYHIVPQEDARRGDGSTVWRVILAPVGISAEPLALEVHGDVVIGSDENDESGVDVNLSGWQGYQHGVSRRHLMLRPSRNKLFLMDLRSTNGTQINGLPLGVGWAYALQDGDLVSLGRLHLRIHIAARPISS